MSNKNEKEQVFNNNPNGDNQQPSSSGAAVTTAWAFRNTLQAIVLPGDDQRIELGKTALRNWCES